MERKQIVYVLVGIFLVVDAFVSIVSYLAQSVFFLVFCFVRAGIGMYMIYHEIGWRRVYRYYEEKHVVRDVDNGEQPESKVSDVSTLNREKLMIL